MTPAGLEPGVTRTSTDPPPHENGMPRKARRTVFDRDEAHLKPTSGGFAFSQIVGSIMLGIIINLFYRQSCRAALSAIRMQSQFWA